MFLSLLSVIRCYSCFQQDTLRRREYFCRAHGSFFQQCARTSQDSTELCVWYVHPHGVINTTILPFSLMQCVGSYSNL